MKRHSDEKIKAFNVYFQEQLPHLKNSVKGLKIFEYKKLLYQMWEELPFDQKQLYIDQQRGNKGESKIEAKMAPPAAENPPKRTRRKAAKAKPEIKVPEEDQLIRELMKENTDSAEPTVAEKRNKKTVLMDILQQASPKIPRIASAHSTPQQPQTPQQDVKATQQAKQTGQRTGRTNSNRRKHRHHHIHRKQYLAPTIIIVPYPLNLQPGQQLPPPIEYSLEQFEAYRKQANNRKKDRIITSSSSFSSYSDSD